MKKQTHFLAIVVFCCASLGFSASHELVVEGIDQAPEYLYFIDNVSQLQSAQECEIEIYLDSHEFDKPSYPDYFRSKYFCLLTENQLERTIKLKLPVPKGWGTLKVQTNKLKGRLVFETIQGTDTPEKFFHLYGCIPTSALSINK